MTGRVVQVEVFLPPSVDAEAFSRELFELARQAGEGLSRHPPGKGLDDRAVVLRAFDREVNGDDRLILEERQSGCKHEPADSVVPPMGSPLPTCRKCGMAYMADDDDEPDPTLWRVIEVQEATFLAVFEYVVHANTAEEAIELAGDGTGLMPVDDALACRHLCEGRVQTRDGSQQYLLKSVCSDWFNNSGFTALPAHAQVTGEAIDQADEDRIGRLG